MHDQSMPGINALLRLIFITGLGLGLFSALTLAQTAGTTTPARAVEQFPINPKRPTLFVVGDSTANNQAHGARGWGNSFASYFDTTKINVINRARGGRSSRTFITEGLWSEVLGEMKAGDFVLIQFGHNDGGPLDTGRARGSLPGLGEETREITNPNGQKEVVHTYGWYLRKMIADTKARRAAPIIFSLTVRNLWNNARVEHGSGKYGQWAAAAAKSMRVPFVDLTAIIAQQYEVMGPEKVKELFAGDHTHTSPTGAELNAASVVAGLKRLKACPLCRYLSTKGQAVGPRAPGATTKPVR